MNGQLTLLSSGVSGVLAVDAAGIAQRGERLDGNVVLGGTLAQPNITAQLTGSQDASGTLLATFEPAQNSYSLSSNLALAGLRTNFGIESSQGDLSATGNLAYNNFSLRVSESGANTLILSGEDSLEGWLVTLDVAQRSAELNGSLNALTQSVQGEVSVRASLTGDALSGRIDNLTAAGIGFGTVRIGSDQNRIQLSSDTLEASLDIAERSAELTRLDLALAQGYALAGSGAGTLTEGVFELELLAENSRLPLSLSYDEAGLVVAGENEFLGGKRRAVYRSQSKCRLAG